MHREVSWIFLDVPGATRRSRGSSLGRQKHIDCLVMQKLGLEQYRLRVARIDRHATYTESCARHVVAISN